MTVVQLLQLMVRYDEFAEDYNSCHVHDDGRAAVTDDDNGDANATMTVMLLLLLMMVMMMVIMRVWW